MPNYKNLTIKLLHDIVKQYPNQLLSTHIAIALSDYGEVDGLSDKELHFAFDKYSKEKELDYAIPRNSDLQRIIEEGMDLEKLAKEILNPEEDY